METFDIREELFRQKQDTTNVSILLKIFMKREYTVEIPKRVIEKEFGLTLSLQKVNFDEIASLEDLIREADFLPGDLQRDLRTFYMNFHKFGLRKRGDGKNIVYYWEPISIEEYNFIKNINIPDRNIFKTDAEKREFVKTKNAKCEICFGNERLCIDHWRAYSVYQIDDPRIAVLLCERCNNIHHNLDASVILKKNRYNLQAIKNWISIEKRIRENGFAPNKEDAKQQNNMITETNDYYLLNAGSITELLEMKIPLIKIVE